MKVLQFVLYMICCCLIFSCSFNNPFLPTDELKEAAIHTVQIQFQPGDEATGIMEDLTITKGSSVVLTKNAFSREGYLFKGWQDNRGNIFSDEQEVTFVEDAILTALWKPCAFSVTFYANNGTDEYKIQPADYGDTVTLYGNTFSYTGYEFTGWNTDRAGTGTFYANTQQITVTDNVILYAQWKPCGFSVIFHANNGTDEYKIQSADYGDTVTLYANTFSYTGYEFTGWNTDRAGTRMSYTDAQNITITGNVILYAQWKQSNYNLTLTAPSGYDYKWSTGETTQSITVQTNGKYTCTWKTSPNDKIFDINFEGTGKTGWTTDYEPYYDGCDNGTGPHKWEKQTNENPYSGIYCWYFDGANVDVDDNKITDPISPEKYKKAVKIQNLSLEKDCVYRLKYYGKSNLPDSSTNEDFNAKLCSYLSYNGKNIKIGNMNKFTKDWTEYSAEFSAEESNNNAVFYMYDEETGISYNDFWLDDLSLVRIEKTESKEFVIESGSLKSN